jgi:hypothetical protein
MAKDARIRGQEEEDDNSDEPDHGKPPDQIASPTRDPPKSILKATRVTFGKENSVAIPVKDSIDEDDEEIGFRPKRQPSAFADRSSMYSVYSVDKGKSGTVAIFAALIVLKIIFVDIWTSLGDAITDFLQGFFLIFDFHTGEWKDDTYQYGIIVLIACWVPGIVAVIHILAHYRNEYFGLSKDLAHEFRQSRKKKFCLMIFLCFFFYPFVPTLAYIVNLWHMNGSKQSYNAQTAQLELFARVSHSITGCIEAPFQLIMTSWLIMKGVLDIPWRSSLVNTGGFTDRFENQIPVFSIPMWTLAFSIVDIIGCSIQINIFNVYIGQLRNFKSAKRYMNLVGGHFPFFFHAICFRVITFAFFLIYLDTLALIPLFLIWISNIIIGYATVGKHKIPKNIRPKLKRMQSVARRNANLPKISSSVERKKSNENTPVWLNSFLSIFVPSCFVHTADPALLGDTEGLTEDQKIEHDQVKKDFFDYEKKFQRKVIKYQVQTSTTFLMLSLAIVFYLVNFNESFSYNNNIFSNDEFNVLCCMILGLGAISYLFLFEIDIYDLLHLNEKPGEGGEIIIKYKEKKKKSEDLGEDVPDGVNITVELPGNPDEVEYIERPIKTKRHGPFKKTMVTVIFTLLAVSPIIGGFTYSTLGINSPAYLVVKIMEQDNLEINIQMAKSRLLNNPSPDAKREAEGFLTTCENYQPSCKSQELNHATKILLVNMDDTCFETLNKMDDISCLPFKGIVLMENWDDSSSRPVKFNSNGQSVEKFPIISLSYRDTNKTINLLKNGQFVNIIFDDFDDLLEKETEDIYQVKCPENGCTSMRYPELQGNKQMYIGCDGETKLRANVNMHCTSNGRRCPELESWKKQIEKGQEKFESCFSKQVTGTIVFPPAHCIKEIEAKMPKTCNQEVAFWKPDIRNDENFCWNSETNTVKYWKKECRKEVECENWGSWSNPMSSICTTRQSEERFRFCRKNTDCVLMEIETKWGQKVDGNCTFTEPDTPDQHGNPANCEK